MMYCSSFTSIAQKLIQYFVLFLAQLTISKIYGNTVINQTVCLKNFIGNFTCRQFLPNYLKAPSISQGAGEGVDLGQKCLRTGHAFLGPE